MNIGELVAQIKVDTGNLISGLDKATREIENSSKKIGSSVGKIESGFASLAKTVKVAVAGFIAFQAYALSRRAISGMVNFVKESTLLSSRFATLGVVMTSVGKNVNVSRTQLDAYTKSLEKTGISQISARQSIIRMMQANFDLSKSSQLARIAQDAAVIGNINSSQAFEQMIYGIQTAQIEVLKTIGLNVNFERSYAKLAKQLGKTQNELSEAEKMQARMNVVMEAGANIAGTYEAAMQTTGKRANTLSRYIENLFVSLGKAFDPAYGKIIDTITESIKNIHEMVKKEGVRKAITDVGMAFATVATALINSAEAMAGWLAKFSEVYTHIKENKILIPLGLAPETETFRFEKALKEKQMELESLERKGFVYGVQVKPKTREDYAQIKKIKEEIETYKMLIETSKKSAESTQSDWAAMNDEITAAQKQKEADSKKTIQMEYLTEKEITKQQEEAQKEREKIDIEILELKTQMGLQLIEEAKEREEGLLGLEKRRLEAVAQLNEREREIKLRLMEQEKEWAEERKDGLIEIEKRRLDAIAALRNKEQEAFIRMINNQNKNTKEIFDTMKNAMSGWAADFGSELNDLVWSSDFSFSQIGENFAKMITQMAIQIKVVEPLIKGLFGTNDKDTGVVGSLLQAMGLGTVGGNNATMSTATGVSQYNIGLGTMAPEYMVAHGAVLNGRRMTAFAKGGVLRRPTFLGGGDPILAGEKGDEGVLPLKRTAAGDLGVIAQGIGPRVNVNVINNAGANVSVGETRQTNNGVEIDVLIDKAVAKQMAKRGSGTNKMLRQNFGAQERLVSR